MKKWIYVLVALLIIMIWRGISIYHAAFEPVEKREEHAVKIAMQETSLQEVDDVYTYYGTKAYQVIHGTNEAQEKIIVWVAEEDDKVIVRKQNEGISKDEALQNLYNERNPKEIQSVKLGIENDIPIWEIIYKGDDNRLTYHKMYFKNGNYRNSIKP